MSFQLQLEPIRYIKVLKILRNRKCVDFSNDELTRCFGEEDVIMSLYKRYTCSMIRHGLTIEELYNPPEYDIMPDV